MAGNKGFDIYGYLKLVGPNSGELGRIGADIQKALGGKVDLSSSLQQTQQLAQQTKSLASNHQLLQNSFKSSSDAARLSSDAFARNTKQLQANANSLQDLGRIAGLTVRRFGVFTIVAGTIIGFTRAVRDATSEALNFQKQLVRIDQLGGSTAANIATIEKAVGQLSTSIGVSSQELIQNAVVLKQSGLTALQVAENLRTLADAAVAPNFDSMAETTEGVIAIIRQFNTDAKETRSVIGAMNAVAGEFAVEARDLIEVVRKTGGAFKATGGDAKELIALFTSVRSTTRESAESIATGLRTIFTRIQRNDTVDSLKDLGVELRRTSEEARVLGDSSLENQFVGGYEAVRRLSAALAEVRTTDPRFSSIVEELGGFRQVSKTIPLLTQFGESMRALSVARSGDISLTIAQEKSQQSLLIRMEQSRQKFLEMFRVIANDDNIQTLTRYVLSAADAFTKLIETAKPLLPLIGALGAGLAIRSLGAIGTGAGLGVLGKSIPGTGPARFATGGPVSGAGSRDSIPALLMPGEYVINRKAAQKIGYDVLDGLNSGGVKKFAGGSPGGVGRGRETRAFDLLKDPDPQRQAELEKIYNQLLGVLGSGERIKQGQAVLDNGGIAYNFLAKNRLLGKSYGSDIVSDAGIKLARSAGTILENPEKFESKKDLANVVYSVLNSSHKDIAAKRKRERKAIEDLGLTPPKVSRNTQVGPEDQGVYTGESTNDETPDGLTISQLGNKRVGGRYGKKKERSVNDVLFDFKSQLSAAGSSRGNILKGKDYKLLLKEATKEGGGETLRELDEVLQKHGSGLSGKEAQAFGKIKSVGQIRQLASQLPALTRPDSEVGRVSTEELAAIDSGTKTDTRKVNTERESPEDAAARIREEGKRQGRAASFSVGLGSRIKRRGASPGPAAEAPKPQPVQEAPSGSDLKILNKDFTPKPRVKPYSGAASFTESLKDGPFQTSFSAQPDASKLPIIGKDFGLKPSAPSSLEAFTSSFSARDEGSIPGSLAAFNRGIPRAAPRKKFKGVEVPEGAAGPAIVRALIKSSAEASSPQAASGVFNTNQFKQALSSTLESGDPNEIREVSDLIKNHPTLGKRKNVASFLESAEKTTAHIFDPKSIGAPPLGQKSLTAEGRAKAKAEAAVAAHVQKYGGTSGSTNKQTGKGFLKALYGREYDKALKFYSGYEGQTNDLISGGKIPPPPRPPAPPSGGGEAPDPFRYEQGTLPHNDSRYKLQSPSERPVVGVPPTTKTVPDATDVLPYQLNRRGRGPRGGGAVPGTVLDSSAGFRETYDFETTQEEKYQEQVLSDQRDLRRSQSAEGKARFRARRREEAVDDPLAIKEQIIRKIERQKGILYPEDRGLAEETAARISSPAQRAAFIRTISNNTNANVDLNDSGALNKLRKQQAAKQNAVEVERYQSGVLEDLKPKKSLVSADPLAARQRIIDDFKEKGYVSTATGEAIEKLPARDRNLVERIVNARPSRDKDGELLTTRYNKQRPFEDPGQHAVRNNTPQPLSGYQLSQGKTAGQLVQDSLPKGLVSQLTLQEKEAQKYNEILRKLTAAEERILRETNPTIQAKERRRIAEQRAADALDREARIISTPQGRILGTEESIRNNSNRAGRTRFTDRIGDAYGNIQTAGSRFFSDSGAGGRFNRRFSGINSTTAIGASIVAPIIGGQLESFGGTAQQAVEGGAETRFRGSNALAGVLTGAATGASLAAFSGAGSNPVVIAAAAAGGALFGLVTSLKETSKQISDVRIENSLNEFSTKLGGISKAGLTPSIAAVNAAKSSIVDVRAQLSERDSANSTGFFGGFDLDTYQSVQKQSLRNTFGGQLQGITESLSSQADLLGKSDLGGTLEELNKKLVDGNNGLNREFIRIVAELRGVTILEIQDELGKQIEASRNSRKIAENFAESSNEREKTTNQFGRLLSSIQSAFGSTLSEKTASANALDSLQGQANPTLISTYSQNIEKFGNPNALSPLKVVAGLGGESGRALLEEGKGVSQVSNLLPSILAEVAKNTDPLGEGPDFSTSVRRRLESGLDIKNAPNAENLSRVINSVVSQLESINESSSTEAQDRVGRDVNKLSDDLLSSFDVLREVGREAAQKFEEAANDLIRGTQEYARQQSDLNSLSLQADDLRVDDLRTQRFVSERRKGNTGAAATLSLQELTQPFYNQQDRLVAGTGVGDGLDVGAISGGLVSLKTKRDTLTEKQQSLVSGGKGNTQEFKDTVSDLAQTKSQIVNLQTALKNLAEETNRTASAQEILNRTDQERSGRLGLVEKFATADPGQLAELNRNLALAVSVGQGTTNFKELGVEQRRGVLDIYNSAPGVTLGGVRTEDAKQLALKSVTDGEVLNRSQINAEAEALSLQSSISGSKVNAAEALKTSFDADSKEFFKNLNDSYGKFFKSLDDLFQKNLVTDRENRIASGESKIQKLDKDLEASDLIGKLGLNPNNIDDIAKLKKNTPELLELSKIRAGESSQKNSIDSFKKTITGKKALPEVDSLVEKLRSQEVRGFRKSRVGAEESDLISSLLPGLTPDQKTGVVDRFSSSVERKRGFGLLREGVPIDKKLVISNLIRSVEEELLGSEKERGGVLDDQLGVSGIDTRYLRTPEFRSSLDENQGRLSNFKTKQGIVEDKDAIERENERLRREIEEAQGLADGGSVFRARGTDTVPAMLTPGEFVVNREAAQANMGLLKKINSGKTKYLAGGGSVEEGESIESQKIRYYRPAIDKAREVVENEILMLNRDGISNPDLPLLRDSDRDLLKFVESKFESGEGYFRVPDYDLNQDNNYVLFTGHLGELGKRPFSQTTYFERNPLQASPPDAARRAAKIQSVKAKLATLYDPDSQLFRRERDDRVKALQRSQFLSNYRDPGEAFGAGTPGLEEQASFFSGITSSVESKRREENDKFLKTIPDYNRYLESVTKGQNFKLTGFASGGVVPGFGGGDTVPAMLTPGEFVLNKNATAKAGVGNLQRFNSGGIVEPRYLASGGSVSGGEQQLSISQASAGALSGFSTSANQLVNSLGQFRENAQSISQSFNSFAGNAKALTDALSAMPKTITGQFQHSVNISISGAEALEKIMPEIKQMIISETKKILQQTFKEHLPQAGVSF